MPDARPEPRPESQCGSEYRSEPQPEPGSKPRFRSGSEPQPGSKPRSHSKSQPEPRLVLAFDTAGEVVALAVGRRERNGGITPLVSDDQPARRQANVRLMPMIDALFAANGLARETVACVVCGLGPGSFTGVRIGVATAKGIARGLRVPLFGVSTLDAVAWGAWLAGVRGGIGVVADAMRGEVYPARFTLDETGATRLSPHTVAKADEVAVRWREAGTDLLLIGDGLHKYAEVFTAAGAAGGRAGGPASFALGDAALWTPTGAGLLRAFEDARARGVEGTGEAGTLLPVYTRLSDAEEHERKRLADGGKIAQGALVEVPLSGVADPARLGTVVYRPMATDDLDQVSALEQAAFPAGAGTSGECWTRALFADELTRRDRSWWVAYVDGLLVGFAGAWVVDGSLQVLDVVVAEAHRRRGIARKLLHHLMQDGIDLGATRASLEVRASNEGAQALYASLGFERLGVRPDYYAPRDGAPREAAVIMERAADCVGIRHSVLDTESNGSLMHDGGCRTQTMRIQEPRQGFSHSLVGNEGGEGLRGEGGKGLRGEGGGAERTEGARGEEVRGERGEGVHGGAEHAEAEHAEAEHAEAARAEAKRSLAHHPSPRILAIETSCDETAAAVIDGAGQLLSDTVASQVDFHARFGGVVPEIASRKHTESIVGVVDAALDEAGLHDWRQLDALAVTYAPGLIGALVVGVAFAKGLSWASGLKLIRVNHLEGHIYANRLKSAGSAQKDDALSPPFVIALLSGGHTMLVRVSDWGDYHVLGQTLDDAVGEAFDKVAKALGLGYPGGPVISRLAEQGDPAAFNFPRALLHSHDYHFSLSGLKTAVITFIRKEQEAGRPLDLPGIAASFQQAVIDVQVAKALEALEETGCTTFCLGGGVAANRALREAYEEKMTKRGIRVVFPPGNACTDNAAMIARVALDRFRKGCFMALDDDAFARGDLEHDY